MNLRNHYLLDRDNRAEAVIYPKRTAFAKPFDRRIHLVKYLLKPKLVRLMNNDEEQFVVARWH